MWLIVRTKAFKNWFGDLERLEKKKQLENAPIVEIPINEFKNTENKNARRQAFDWVENIENFKKDYITSIGKVTIDKRSVKDSLSHNSNLKKINAVFSLREGFKNAVYISSEKDFTRNNAINHYFVYPAIYNNKKQ